MAKIPKRQFVQPNYKDELNKAQDFLRTFSDNSIIDDHPVHKRLKYMIELQKIANRQSKRIDILLEDLEALYEDEREWLQKIRTNTLSYQKLFYHAADLVLPQPDRDYSVDEDAFDDQINRQREMNLEQDQADQRKKLPPELHRRYQLFIIRGPQTKTEILAVRDLKAKLIGSLITVRAMVVRTSEVRPQLLVACYSCDACGYENYQTVYGRSFTPLLECQSDKCHENKVRGRLIFNHGSSKFISNQEIKIQEIKEQLPKGAIPRAFTILARGDTNTRVCSPGDIIIAQGVFLPIEKEGYFANKTQFYVTYIEAFKIIREKRKYNEINLESTASLRIHEDYDKLTFQEQYTKLARSIAPEIYGMEDVKKALLLMIVGGVTKEMHDGLRIRGDINVALIGDPGVAKSQLLRYIAQASPRGIYTTGKGSSSVGLTAAVMRDPVTGEMTLEGGALVMADRGVCCIDEFDKMNESDRTAIHEVMEQQTVSIAKAGITTTLNARTSILAAANPLYGRYNKKHTPHQNINLPAALLSRFDLIFILLDEANLANDERMAKHISKVHQNKYKEKGPEEAERRNQLYNLEEISTFIAFTRRFEPVVTELVHKYIADQYIERRRQTFNQSLDGYSYTTPRTLLAIIRLSQALAKLRFKQHVSQDDVEEAIRLMDISQESVRRAQEIDPSDQNNQRRDNTVRIFDQLKVLSRKYNNHVDKDQLIRVCQSQGFQKQDVLKFLETYERLNQILVHGENRDKIQIVMD